GEWIMNCGDIPVADYKTLATQFNPTKFDAESWVVLAKEAGMKYIVITAKHHDGFALWPSKASPFNIADATPFKRDPLAELASACRKHGLKLGFYYSQAQDWTHPGGACWKYGPRSTDHWDPAQLGSFDDYIDSIAVPQTRELLTRYGSDVPAVLWWDTPRRWMQPSHAKKINDVVQEIRPGLIMNNRLGGGIQGDTETPEQYIPPQGYPGRDWETCMTMNDTWGFKSYDHNWKSNATLLRNLCDIASKGGNYLLNVGPDGEGSIPQPSIDSLRAMGRWMKVNGEAIYGSQATPFGPEAGRFSETEKDNKGQPKFIPSWEWRATTKPGRVYLHLMKWPNQPFTLSGLLTQVRKVYLLADPKKTPIPFEQTASSVVLRLPASAPDPEVSVVCLELQDREIRTEPTVQQSVPPVGSGTGIAPGH
ncbi:MAG: alpha-L-fucosidase, partial [Candidatus Methylacidiphilales bacterium]|nr:alpha-L-fucosidase [Candidatus Methylacidiphilales bacterium]